MMLRVALTGGIATGKSYVARRMRAAGVPVVDADVLAREAVAPGTPQLKAIAERFGTGVLGHDGALDRARLAGIVFADPGARQALEAIVHPAVRAAIDQFYESLPEDTPFAVADIPLLFETNRADAFDMIVVAACPPEMQVDRVVARDGVGREEALQRLAAQLPIAEKVGRADYVIDTSGSFAATDAAVDGVLAALRACASRA
ncbi:MAG: dephospho-CoA kinase [Acidobacteria bacterium]|nr:dephospho-CoA kinase [Acidobacteriota bacterium]